MPLKPHPTDPEKMVYVKRHYRNPEEAWDEPEEHMNTKTFEAVGKLKEVELELHRLKNALEMANRALGAQRTWVGLTDEEINSWEYMPMFFNMTTALEVVPTVAQFARFLEAKIKDKNT